MEVVVLVLVVLALVLLALEAFGVVGARWDLVAAALFCVVLALLLSNSVFAVNV